MLVWWCAEELTSPEKGVPMSRNIKVETAVARWVDYELRNGTARSPIIPEACGMLLSQADVTSRRELRGWETNFLP